MRMRMVVGKGREKDQEKGQEKGLVEGQVEAVAWFGSRLGAA